MTYASLLLKSLRNPGEAARADLPGWSRLLRELRRADLLPLFCCRLQETAATDHLPVRVREHLAAGVILADSFQRSLGWEVDRIRRALRDVNCPVLFLKGAAYAVAGLPMARGRRVRDVDVLVPVNRLSQVEQALRRHGWLPLDTDEYDDHYYRTWMHELPPMKHRERGTVIDVHHTLLPPSGRLHPDPQKLFAAAREVAGGLQVPSPADMVLHSAAHFFEDGDLAGGLRDLCDLDGLLRHFGETEADFWKRLGPRAWELGLQRPLYYALQLTGRLLGTRVPERVLQDLAGAEPVRPVRWLMPALVTRAVVPARADGSTLTAELARLLLYIRAHWLRMPPWLLARHLWHKASLRWKKSRE